MVNFRTESRKVLAYVGSWHFSDIPPALTNFRFWGQSGRCADACRSPLMTQSGHVRSGNVRQRAGRTACQSGVRTGTTANAVMAPMTRPKVAEVMAPAGHGSGTPMVGKAARAVSLMTWTTFSETTIPYA